MMQRAEGLRQPMKLRLSPDINSVSNSDVPLPKITFLNAHMSCPHLTGSWYHRFQYYPGSTSERNKTREDKWLIGCHMTLLATLLSKWKLIGSGSLIPESLLLLVHQPWFRSKDPRAACQGSNRRSQSV